MLKVAARGKTYFISTVILLTVFAFVHEKDMLVTKHLMLHMNGNSSPLDRWMKSCGLELYPNLKWATVTSQHSTGQSAMVIFVSFAVENNWAIWNSPEVDDSDFRGCPTSCIWVRSRDTSMQGLQQVAPCVAQAHAVLFWLPLGYPAAIQDDSGKVITTLGLTHSDRQIWIGVGTEPGMMQSFRNLFNVTISYEKTSPVPYPFFIKDYEHYAHASVLPWDNRVYNVSLLQSNCNGNKERFELWRNLARVINVSSFQSCLHNTDIPNMVFNIPSCRNNLKKIAIYLGFPDLFDDDFEYIVRRSKFMVIVENSVLVDYVSEKAWQALHLGAVPIYFGAPNVEHVLPSGSFINLRHFATSNGSYDFVALRALLERALVSEEEYARFHAWRLPNLDLKTMKLVTRYGNSQTFVMNRKIYGDRKRLTCDICSHLFTLHRQQKPVHGPIASKP